MFDFFSSQVGSFVLSVKCSWRLKIFIMFSVLWSRMLVLSSQLFLRCESSGSGKILGSAFVMFIGRLGFGHLFSYSATKSVVF